MGWHGCRSVAEVDCRERGLGLWKEWVARRAFSGLIAGSDRATLSKRRLFQAFCQ